VVLDRGPQAVSSYYRRTDGTWQKAGVYGHVEVPGNSHWDPGSLDYPAFFQRVQAILTGGADEMAYEDFKKGWRLFVTGGSEPPDGTDLGFGYRAARYAAERPAPGAHRHDDDYASKGHKHPVVGETT
jgi:hypothetical protein